MLKFGVLFLAAYASTASVNPSESPCVCTRHYNPVCGTDGVTYANECVLHCESKRNDQLTIEKHGSCEGDQSLCLCRLELKPVCGSNGKTYPNQCVFDCEKRNNPKLKLKSAGECPKESSTHQPNLRRVARALNVMSSGDLCVCPDIYKPVCHEGLFYENECMIHCTGINEPKSC